MSKNKPETPVNIQMTPVEFSPKASDNELGSVGGFIPLREMQFPLSIPVAIMLATLIYSTVRDISGFNRRLAEIADQEAPALEMLKKTPKQAEFVEGIRVSLQKIAPTDPIAAQLLREYYPPAQETQAASSSAPAQ